jgi:hypothetical protein
MIGHYCYFCGDGCVDICMAVYNVFGDIVDGMCDMIDFDDEQ